MATPSLRLSVEADDRATKILTDVTKKLGQTGDKAKEAGRKVAAGSRQMDKSLANVKKSAAKATTGIDKLKTVLTVVFAGAVLGAVVRGSDTLLRAFSTQQQAVDDLSLGLKNIGVFSKAAVDEQTAFAASLQKTTTFGDESIISLQAQLTAFGLYGDELKDATRATLDLSSKLKISLQTSSILVGKAALGMTNSLRSYGIIVDDTLPKNEKFAAAMKAINEQMGGAAQAQVASYAGQTTQLGNRIGDLAERLGQELVPVFKSWASILDSVIDKTEEFIGVSEDSLSVDQITINRTEAKIAVRRRELKDLVNARQEFGKRATQIRNFIALDIRLINETKKRIQVNREAGKVAEDAAGKEFKARKALEEQREKGAAGLAAREKAEGEALKEIADLKKSLHIESLELAGLETEAKKQMIEDELEAQREALVKLGEAAGLTAEEIAPIFESIRANATAKIKSIKTEGSKDFLEMAGVAKTAADAIESTLSAAFVDILFEGKTSAEKIEQAFKSMLRSIFQDLARLAIRAAITAPAGGGGFFGGIFAQHGIQRVPGPIGQPVPAILHGGEQVTPFGGRVQAGGAAGGDTVINVNLRVADLEPSERRRVVMALTDELRTASDEAREFSSESELLAERNAGRST